MKNLRRILVILLFLGFCGLQMAAFIDDPHHLTEPDPDCVLCIVAQMSFVIDHQVIIEFTPDLITYFIDPSFLIPASQTKKTTRSPRAPPTFPDYAAFA